MYLQVFEIKPLRAWGAVATTVVSVALSVYLISISPTYLLPLAWAFAGTAWTGVSQFPGYQLQLHLSEKLHRILQCSQLHHELDRKQPSPELWLHRRALTADKQD